MLAYPAFLWTLLVSLARAIAREATIQSIDIHEELQSRFDPVERRGGPDFSYTKCWITKITNRPNWQLNIGMSLLLL
jgi:hypothetical protein